MIKTNVGIIGLGNMGLLHMYNCLHMEDVIVTAVADTSKTARNKAKSYGVQNTYEDYHDLLQKSNDLDVVVISLPNFLHYNSVKLALEEGLNVFIEKPMANSVKEGLELSKTSKKSGRKLTIGHSMRYIPGIQKMKEAIDDGLVGNVEVITSEMVLNGPFSHPAVPRRVPEWWFDPDKVGGGALHDLGYHLIDLYRFFKGEAEVIFSNLDYKFNLPIEDGAIIILKSRDSDTKGIINTGWYQKSIFPKYNFRSIIHGNAGYLSTDEYAPKNPYIFAAKIGIKNVFKKIFGKKITPLAYSYYYESYYHELYDFFKCINDDSIPSVTPQDGIEVLKLISDAYTAYNKRED